MLPNENMNKKLEKKNDSDSDSDFHFNTDEESGDRFLKDESICSDSMPEDESDESDIENASEAMDDESDFIISKKRRLGENKQSSASVATAVIPTAERTARKNSSLVKSQIDNRRQTAETLNALFVNIDNFIQQEEAIRSLLEKNNWQPDTVDRVLENKPSLNNLCSELQQIINSNAQLLQLMCSNNAEHDILSTYKSRKKIDVLKDFIELWADLKEISSIAKHFNGSNFKKEFSQGFSVRNVFKEEIISVEQSEKLKNVITLFCDFMANDFLEKNIADTDTLIQLKHKRNTLLENVGKVEKIIFSAAAKELYKIRISLRHKRYKSAIDNLEALASSLNFLIDKIPSDKTLTYFENTVILIKGTKKSKVKRLSYETLSLKMSKSRTWLQKIISQWKKTREKKTSNQATTTSPIRPSCSVLATFLFVVIADEVYQKISPDQVSDIAKNIKEFIKSIYADLNPAERKKFQEVLEPVKNKFGFTWNYLNQVDQGKMSIHFLLPDSADESLIAKELPISPTAFSYINNENEDDLLSPYPQIKQILFQKSFQRKHRSTSETVKAFLELIDFYQRETKRLDIDISNAIANNKWLSNIRISWRPRQECPVNKEIKPFYVFLIKALFLVTRDYDEINDKKTCTAHIEKFIRCIEQALLPIEGMQDKLSIVFAPILQKWNIPPANINKNNNTMMVPPVNSVDAVNSISTTTNSLAIPTQPMQPVQPKSPDPSIYSSAQTLFDAKGGNQKVSKQNELRPGVVAQSEVDQNSISGSPENPRKNFSKKTDEYGKIKISH